MATTTAASLYVFIPIHRNKPAHRAWKDLRGADWQVKEVRFEIDLQQLADGSVPKPILDAVIFNHVFFMVIDGLVGETTLVNLYCRSKCPDVRKMFAQQIATEALHAEAYRRVAKVLTRNNLHAFEALCQQAATEPVIVAKVEWAKRHTAEDQPLAKQIFAQAVVEGVFFGDAFALLTYCRKLGYLPGIGQNNDLVMGEESMHWQNSAYVVYPNEVAPADRLSTKEVHQLLDEAILIEDAYNKRMLGPEGIPQLTLAQFNQHARYCADNLAKAFGYSAPYGVENPFDFMLFNSLASRLNFFEKSGAEYVVGESLPDIFSATANLD